MTLKGLYISVTRHQPAQKLPAPMNRPTIAMIFSKRAKPPHITANHCRVLFTTARRLRTNPPDTNSKADQRWRAITVPSFNILYKTLADDDGWESGLGPFFPNQDEALYFFNKTMAKDKGLGRFTFDYIDIPSDYYLVEIATGPIRVERKSHPLYMRRAEP